MYVPRMSLLLFLLTVWTQCQVPGLAEDGGRGVQVEMGSSALEASISQLADRLGKLEDDRKVLTGQLEELKMEHSQLRDKLSRPPDTQPRVAFHAWLGTSPIYVTPFSRLILREITTNVGSAYNATTGKFVAPVPGVYLFTVTTAANPLNTIFAGLQVMVDYAEVSYVTSRDYYHPDTCTNHVIVSLKAGQGVWLYLYGMSSFAGDHHTTFSGALLHQN